MARIDSLDVLLDPSGKMLLSEMYAGVIENVQKETLSGQLKNKDLSGDPESGTVEAKRFKNATSKAYGTARAAGAGDKAEGKPVTIPIDTDREFVEELEKKDVKLLGVEGLLQKRATNHKNRMKAELDSAFFACGNNEGTKFIPVDPTANIEVIIENAILTLETLQTAYIDGIDRDLMAIACSPAIYSRIRAYLDTVTNTGITTQDEKIQKFHGVRIDSCNRLPAGVEFEIMVEESIAQPVTSEEYTAEKIPLSQAIGVSLFFSYGTKAVTPELILTAQVASGIVATAAAGTASGDTVVTITTPSALPTNTKYMYKIFDDAPKIYVGTDVSGWTALTSGSTQITAASTKYVGVVNCNTTDEIALLAGSVKSVPKS